MGTVWLIAKRESRLLLRGHAGQMTLLSLLALVWLPALALPLRHGQFGLAPAPEALALALSLTGTVVPLLALLHGADALSGEIEDGSLVSLLAAPVSRRACLLGKLLGRGLVLGAAYAMAYGSLVTTYLVVGDGGGVLDLLVIALAGAALGVVLGLLGCLLGIGAAGRVRAFGRALTSWILLVFLLDAVLLGILVATSPPLPESVGCHGHSELQDLAQRRDAALDPAQRSGPWLLLLNPVDLYRLTIVAASPVLRQRLERFLPAPVDATWVGPLTVGWLLWGLLPLGLSLRGFERRRLR